MYSTPKTNWTKESYFNVSDYERIYSNLLFLCAETQKYVPMSAPEEPGIPEYTEIALYSYIKAIVNNHNILVRNPVTLKPVQAIAPLNDKTPMMLNYQQLNTMESNIQYIYEQLPVPLEILGKMGIAAGLAFVNYFELSNDFSDNYTLSATARTATGLVDCKMTELTNDFRETKEI